MISSSATRFERDRYEKDALSKLSDMAKSSTERQAIGAVSREYEERVRSPHEAPPVEKLMNRMANLIRLRLPQGVAGRSEKEWRALLGEAADREEEMRER